VTVEQEVLARVIRMLTDLGIPYMITERQLADVAGIVDVKGRELDREYIHRWALALGVSDLWKRVSGTEG
jgi:hypothetical protein